LAKERGEEGGRRKGGREGRRVTMERGWDWARKREISLCLSLFHSHPLSIFLSLNS
jgi:hypothetical protein